MSIIFLLEDLLPIMKQVYDISYRKEIKGGESPRQRKDIFDI